MAKIQAGTHTSTLSWSTCAPQQTTIWNNGGIAVYGAEEYRYYPIQDAEDDRFCRYCRKAFRDGEVECRGCGASRGKPKD